mmetsp:Transcript_9968/g.26407  ORF Transcript_9968/g.26407 Transcript_9968/m.26407 type:complete len:239 (-) Transcript_9968:111-827(-)
MYLNRVQQLALRIHQNGHLLEHCRQVSDVLFEPQDVLVFVSHLLDLVQQQSVRARHFRRDDERRGLSSLDHVGSLILCQLWHEYRHFPHLLLLQDPLEVDLGLLEVQQQLLVFFRHRLPHVRLDLLLRSADAACIVVRFGLQGMEADLRSLDVLAGFLHQLIDPVGRLLLLRLGGSIQPLFENYPHLLDVRPAIVQGRLDVIDRVKELTHEGALSAQPHVPWLPGNHACNRILSGRVH